VNYFERLWSELPDSPPEHFALRRQFMLGTLSPPARVLDVGCGAGWFAAELTRAGFSVVGADVAEEPLRRARARSPAARFVLASQGELPFAAASFDAAWLGEVVEHVQDVVGLLEEVARVVVPGGGLALSTPDHGWRRRLALGLSARAFERHFEPRSDHVRFFTARTLTSLLDACGFGEIATASSSGVLLASARLLR
jgi:2-polyprenyl-3-methyl-5-hydroxy-6-metoxy-1,4-benzoquinol methylase